MNADYVNYAERAARELEETVGLRVIWWPPAGKEMPAKIEIRSNTGSVELIAILNRQPTSQFIDVLLKTSHELAGKSILVAGVIPKDLARALRELKLNYLDAAGNSFVQAQGLFVHIEGRKAVVVPPMGKQLFNKSGLRVLFTLLTQPDAINFTVRELAKRTGVSVGTAQQTLDSFRQSGYIVPVDSQRRKLVSLGTLTDQWINRYGDTLKPSLQIGRFRLPTGMQPSDWQQINLLSGSYWSGEAAADALTNNLRPALLTLYTQETLSGLIKTYRLLPDANGQVEVNKLFWTPSDAEYTNVPVVPPLLVYTDLVNSADPRNVNVARLIRQQYAED